MEPVVEIEPNPPSSKLLVAVVERAVMSTAADALPLDANDQSAASIGQLEALYHSASSPRLSASIFPSRSSFNDAEVTVAPSGNAEVSKRSNPANTW